MNRNTIIAFILIIVCFRFFFSEFYYEKILRKPYPFKKQEKVEQKQVADTTQVKKEVKRDKPKAAPIVEDTLVKVDTLLATNSDTVQLDTITIDTVWIETDKIICGISEMGGKIISIKTKEFTYGNGKEKDKKELIELVPAESEGGTGLRINEEQFDNRIFKHKGDKKKLAIANDEKVVVKFTCDLQEDKNLTKQFSFYKGKYKIGYKIISEEIDGKKVETGWGCGINESEKSSGRMAQLDQRRIHLYDGKSVEHIIMKKKGGEERTGYYNWMAITSKYFLVAIVPEKIKDAEIGIKAFEIKKNEEEEKKNKTLNFKLLYKNFASGNEESLWLYAGPSQLTEMKKYDIGLQKVLFRGYRWFFWADKWFPAVCEFVLWLLIQLQKGVKDYGVVIIILTIILRIVTYPLTQSSMKSMNKMKELQPRINKIRERYKGNPKLMNQKIMEFYRNEGINPLGGMGGCLPMLLQMPIMISLFIVLRKAIELRGQGTFLIPWIKDLSQAEVLFPLGFNIPLYGSNVALLPILMAVLMYFQNKATIKDPNQKAMIYFMPIMMLVLFNNFPSGLCLYFTFSTALQVIQQVITDKKKKAAS